MFLRAYFVSTEDREGIVRRLKRNLDTLDWETSISLEEVPYEDWSIAWRKHFRPVFPTPKIAICQPWESVSAPEGGFTILIEPKMAFGTGHHESTRLALKMLSKVLGEGDQVLDVGTGSGILSIAAVKLGAGEVTGIDTDPLAVENAGENLVLNGLEGRVNFFKGSVSDVDGLFDLVVANLLSSILIPMLPSLKRCLNSRSGLILGGILDREQTKFLEAVQAIGLVVEQVDQEGEWMCVFANKK